MRKTKTTATVAPTADLVVERLDEELVAVPSRGAGAGEESKGVAESGERDFDGVGEDPGDSSNPADGDGDDSGDVEPKVS